MNFLIKANQSLSSFVVLYCTTRISMRNIFTHLIDKEGTIAGQTGKTFLKKYKRNDFYVSESVSIVKHQHTVTPGPQFLTILSLTMMGWKEALSWIEKSTICFLYWCS